MDEVDAYYYGKEEYDLAIADFDTSIRVNAGTTTSPEARHLKESISPAWEACP